MSRALALARQLADTHNLPDGDLLYLLEHRDLEAAELLEVFQWSAEDVNCTEKTDKIKEELADVLIYCVMMADTCGLDLDEIVREKMRKNGEKYPVELSRGSKEKYDELKEGN